MKKLLSTSFILFTSFVAFSQVNEAIVGKWKFKEIVDDGKIDSTGKHMLSSFFNNFYIYLKADGKYTAYILKKEEGNWSFADSTKMLKLLANKGTITEVSLLLKKDTEMLFSFDTDKTLLLEKTTPTENDKGETIGREFVLEAVNKQQLIKKWSFQKRENPNSSNEVVEITNNLFQDNISFAFQADNSYHVQIGKIDEKGVWQLEPNNITLILDVEGNKKFWQIKKLTDTELILVRGNSAELWYFQVSL